MSLTSRICVNKVFVQYIIFQNASKYWKYVTEVKIMRADLKDFITRHLCLRKFGTFLNPGQFRETD